MRTDLCAAFAVNTLFFMIVEGIFKIGIKHQIIPIYLHSSSTIPKDIPDTVINAMTGTYLKISFFTPVLDGKGVEPVKFRPRYAITAGIIRSGIAAPATAAHFGISEVNPNAKANGIAASVPRMKPFVEKS